MFFHNKIDSQTTMVLVADVVVVVVVRVIVVIFVTIKACL